jgi:hypothetical protein
MEPEESVVTTSLRRPQFHDVIAIVARAESCSNRQPSGRNSAQIY